jgi:hypothetical protein
MAGPTKSIGNIQIRSLRLAAPNIDLMPEDQNFGLAICARFEKRGEKAARHAAGL